MIAEIEEMDNFNTPVILIKRDSSELLCNSSMMVIKGEVGSGKSRLVMNIMKGLLLGHEDLNLEYTICPEDKHILYFSTEMSKYHIQRRLLKVLEDVPQERKKNLHFFDGSSTDDLYADILIMCEKYPPYVIIIDQLGDMVININDAEQSKKLVNKLMNGVGKTDCSIIGILHQNEDSGISSKARGHLGSILEQKVVSSIAISDNTKGFHIKSTKIREGKQLDIKAIFNEKTEMLMEKKFVVTKTLEELKFPLSRQDMIKELNLINDCKDRMSADILSKLLSEGTITQYKEGRNVFYNLTTV